jgi:hypothetical protein
MSTDFSIYWRPEYIVYRSYFSLEAGEPPLAITRYRDIESIESLKKFGKSCWLLTLKQSKLNCVFLHEIQEKHVTLNIKHEYINDTKRCSVIKLLVARRVISEVITVVPPENGGYFRAEVTN